MIVQLLLISIVLFLLFFYLIGIYNENYWTRRGLKFHQKNKALGPFFEFLYQKRALFELFDDIYKKYREEPAVGVGNFLRPSLYIPNPTNIQHVLHTDFQSFNHRALEFAKADLLADNLLLMQGNRWKVVRSHMTPLFTTAKLKNMYDIIDKSARDFVSMLKEDPKYLKHDTFNTLTTFCSAAIGAAVFGISTESIFDSPFLKMASESVKPTLKRNLKFAFMNISPGLAKALGVTAFKEFEDFFINAIKQVIRQREKENVKKHDFADLCVSLQKMGVLRDPETGLELKPTDELLAAQAFFFFIAGVEPTATGIFGVLIQLGLHPEILQKVLDEVDETFKEHGGLLNYDAVNNMVYLEKVVSESMRMIPPIGFSTRQATRDTVLPVGNIKVAKDTVMFTRIFELHYDAKYYPKPEVFDPERFSNDSKSGDITYQPFGKGPRICIGMRYARLQMKAALVHLLRDFSVTCSYTDGANKIKFSKQQVQVRPTNVEVELVPRKKNE